MSGSEDNKVWLWDLQTREVVQVLEGHGGALISLRLYLCNVTDFPSLQIPSLPSQYVSF